MANLRSFVKQNLGQGELWAFSSALAYSLDNVFTALAVKGQGINYLLGASLRSLPVLIFSVVMVSVFNKKGEQRTSPFKNLKLILSLASYGALTFFLGNTMFFSALQKGGVLVTTPLAGTQVLWAALFAVLLLGERLNRKMVAGMVISIVGIFILAVGKSGGVELAPQWWLAIPLALGTAICWSLSGVFIAYAQREGVNRFQALLFALVVGNITLNGYLLLTNQIDVYTTTSIPLMGNVIAAGIFNMFALIGITTALGLTTVASASTINSVQVGLAPVMAWIILSEQMNVIIAFGILLILTGVIYVQLNRHAIKTNDNSTET